MTEVQGSDVIVFVNPPMWRCDCRTWNSRETCMWCGRERAERPTQAIPDMCQEDA